MSRFGRLYECGARIVTVRASAMFFAKGEAGTVVESARDGNYRVRFDSGSTWWLNESEFKRMPPARTPLGSRLRAAWKRCTWSFRA